MNKALLITNNNKSIENVKTLISRYVSESRILILSEEGNHRPTRSNLEKAILWLRCSKCEAIGLHRCSHGYNHYNATLYLVIDMPNDSDIVSCDGKSIPKDYLFSNLFYALPSGVKLWGLSNIVIDNLEFKLEKTDRDTFRIAKSNSIPLKGDITIVTVKDIKEITNSATLLNVLQFASCLSFAGSFSINNAFLEPLKL